MLREAYEKLLESFGPQRWWPAESQLEIMVGAVLTQNTAWRNVRHAMQNLRDEGTLSLTALRTLHVEELADLIRPAGYYRVKARRLKNLINWIASRHAGDLEAFLSLPTNTLREELLQINGIGPETADAIVLYAAEKPIFVIDNYTARVLKRHGWIELEADYYAMQEFFHQALPKDAALFNEYHALLVRVGQEFCGTRPKCEHCPLNCLLPDGGPYEGE